MRYRWLGAWVLLACATSLALYLGADTRRTVGDQGDRLVRVERQVTLTLRLRGRGRLRPRDVRAIRRLIRREVAVGQGNAPDRGPPSRRP